MKLLFAIAVFLLFALKTHANTDFTPAIIGNRILLIGEGKYYGSRIKTGFLFVAAQELNRRYFQDTASIQLQFNIHKHVYGDKVFAHKRKYSLGYYERNLDDFDDSGEPYRYSKRNCLVLDCISDEISTEECLKLIYWGLKNTEYLRHLQQTIFVQNAQGALETLRSSCCWSNHTTIYGPIDFAKTIPSHIIDSVLKNEIPEINEMLSYPFFSAWWNGEPDGALDYYTKDDSIYFFKGRTAKLDFKDDYWQQLEILKNTIGKYDIRFKFENISHFASNSLNDYIIFTNQTTMYHYALDRDKLTGPILTPIVKELAHRGFHIDHVTSHNDTLKLHILTNLGKYYILYDTNTRRIAIDTSQKETKELIHKIRDYNQAHEKEEAKDKAKDLETLKKEIFVNTVLPQRRLYIALLTCCILLFSGFLALTKKI